MDDVRVHTGTLIADLILSEARSLKERRAVLRAVTQRLRNEGLAVAQIGPTELVQRAFLAVGAVSGSPSQVQQVLDGAERILFSSAFTIGEVRRFISSESYRSAR